MADTRLTIPRLRVTLDDGREYTVQALNPDLIAWDRTAAKQHWPQGNAAPFLWLTFLAWKASIRAGELPADTTWESFSETICVQVANVTDDDGPGVDEANPTLLAVVHE